MYGNLVDSQTCTCGIRSALGTRMVLRIWQIFGSTSSRRRSSFREDLALKDLKEHIESYNPEKDAEQWFWDGQGKFR